MRKTLEGSEQGCAHEYKKILILHMSCYMAEWPDMSRLAR